ncbi:MAG: prepilin-type N-terminal cleavage/methylation domain-containing protein, partial [Planctomycetes bacterium]|nr:prepilin-type N-terminal cleavage/methylation domain-containing protein [Planctomycetota bacterium]
MNPRIPYASVASRGVPAPVPAPGVLRGTGHSSFVNARRALTLVEMLIGMAITLLMMAAIVNLFANIGSGVRIRRAAMEMGGQLRMVRATLFNDLAGATCRALPWQRPDEDPGYLEIIEGVYSDKNPSALVPFANNTTQVPSSQINPLDGASLGDYDDILALTVRNESAPFRGRSFDFAATPPVVENIESNFAEIIWFAVENPADGSLGEPGMRTIYRRVMLIAPWVDPIDLTAYPTSGSPLVADDANAFYQRYDISARFDTVTQRWIPNTLGDLTKR